MFIDFISAAKELACSINKILATGGTYKLVQLLHEFIFYKLLVLREIIFSFLFLPVQSIDIKCVINIYRFLELDFELFLLVLPVRLYVIR